MARVISMHDVRETKKKKLFATLHGGFEPCSQDMTICGDCDGNRAKMKCPRLKEWLSKKERQSV